MLFSFILVACSTDTTTKSENQKEGKKKGEPEVLFSYEHGEDVDYSIFGISTTFDGSKVLFSSKEVIKRNDEFSSYLVDGNKKAVDIRKLSPLGDKETSCGPEHLSPNGKFLVFNCVEDDNFFTIYDLVEKKILHEEPTGDHYTSKIIGITNDGEVIFNTIDGDTLSIYNYKDSTIKEYPLTNNEDKYEKIVQTFDGKKILINGFYSLYMLDRTTEEMQEIINLESYHERLNRDDIFIYNPQLSPNGKYVYFKISQNVTQDPVYESHFFGDLEEGTLQSYVNFEYKEVGNIDEKGNILLTDGSELYLYNIEKEENHLIPDFKIGGFKKGFTLSGDGKSLFYTDREESKENKEIDFLYKLPLKKIEDYKVVDFKAEKEKEEEGETSGSIKLQPVEEDVKVLFSDVWRKSAEVEYPTVLPTGVSYIQYGMGPGSYSQTIHLESEDYSSSELIFYANDVSDQEGSDGCLVDDLELAETKDGIDYYFYMFDGDEAELAFEKNNWCYSFEAEELTKEEIFAAAYSLKKADTVPSELPIESVLFPTKLPFKSAKLYSPYVQYLTEHNKFAFSIVYGSDQDFDIKYNISQAEPTLYNQSDNVSVQLSNAKEANFNEKSLVLHMFDGTYYYEIQADISSELLQKYGVEEIKNKLIEIGESIK
ncbi:hypothetical protein [Fredinandcohnia quinoae]|uniref:Uncharacterized protein n=1 Tax=Fredinandcohnia quinoae TaxID=2918902 RepID=A0AAW5EFT4_9BACI|nr:hypothetical protein [Fredinandcohnia sp. SECRCQ15]MCH1627699.1 hypothetical protein [Fredinandcohnia sp. SECRCQ15]